MPTLPIGPAQDVDSSRIEAKYKDKLVVLRGAYCGQELKFDASGVLVSKKQPVHSAKCQSVLIQQVSVQNGKLRVAAQRVVLSDNCEKALAQEIARSPEATNDTAGDNGNPERGELLIEMQLPARIDDATMLQLMEKLFLIPSGSLPGATFRVGPDVIPPEPIFSPDPDYAEEARQAGFEGTAVLTIIIGTDGLVRRAAVVRALGKGLDEKAVEKVSTWRFKPAVRCGIPVAVEVRVEVEFSLCRQSPCPDQVPAVPPHADGPKP
jgi:TonB family protein